MDGVSFEKEGPNHRLIIDEVDDIHAGTYRFEAEGIKTEAKIFVEGKFVKLLYCPEKIQYSLIVLKPNGTRTNVH